MEIKLNLNFVLIDSNELITINAGSPADYDFGYKVGKAVGSAWSWFKNEVHDMIYGIPVY